MVSFWRRSLGLLKAEAPEYQQLQYHDDDSVKEQPQILEVKFRRPTYFKYIIIGLGIMNITLVVFSVWSTLPRRAKHLPWVPCGSTSAEARANGCHYEPMQRSWIPDTCYTSSPSEEYTPFDDREWFYDVNLTRRIGEDGLRKLREGEELPEGEDNMAYAHMFHNEHCIYCWRKLSIAVEKRLPLIDSKTKSLAHTTHCAKGIAKQLYDVGRGDTEKYHKQVAYSPLMFQTCVELDWR
jgi:hypothetical protein